MEIRHDRLTPALAARFAATLDREARTDTAPQGLHWCLCTPDAPTGDLGPDGHPLADTTLPPRRMWASSEVRFLAPLPIGAEVERRSRVTGRVEKQGASGPLVFVTHEHVTWVQGRPAIEETQTVVYRQPASGSPPPLAPAPAEPAADGPWRRTVTPSPTLLFRYSALTFNSHRIHYDQPYAETVEGYPGLVVHGPLMATLLLDLADRKLGPNRLASFAFRAREPAFAGPPLQLSGEADGGELRLAVRNAAGTLVMSAEASVA